MPIFFDYNTIQCWNTNWLTYRWRNQRRKTFQMLISMEMWKFRVGKILRACRWIGRCYVKCFFFLFDSMAWISLVPLLNAICLRRYSRDDVINESWCWLSSDLRSFSIFPSVFLTTVFAFLFAHTKNRSIFCASHPKNLFMTCPWSLINRKW